jgi:methylglutaconyl-CoA hydratase
MAQDASSAIVLTAIDARGVATVTLNRPERRNAYNRDMIRALIAAFGALAADPKVRVILLRGNGKVFQAGADLEWIKANRDFSWEENLAVSQDTTNAVRWLNQLPKPVIALVHGGVFGGGTGVIAACDVVIAAEDTQFAITEAKWGLVATPILPQLVARMGLPNVRRYAMSCERFDARRAKEIGLVDEVCPNDGLDAAVAPIVEALLQCGPEAIAETKRSLIQLSGQYIDDEKALALAVPHAAKRLTPEAVEGLDSFLQGRPPAWYQPTTDKK